MKNAIVGVDTPQVNAREKVLGRAVYAGDIQFAGMLHVKVLRSPYAHAKIINIDTAAAKALRGVRLVLTGDDAPKLDSGAIRKEHRILATGKVRHIGEEVVAVAATDEAIALDALDLIKVEYEELPAIFDPEEALRSEISVHEDRRHGDHNNVGHAYEIDRGDVDAAFAKAAAIYEATYDAPSQYPGYMEPMATVAWMGGDGRLTVWASTQMVFLQRARYAEALGMPASNIRVIQATTGGGFGGKAVEECNSLIAAFVASRTDRPVRFLNSRLEDFQGARMSVPERIWLKMGVDENGMIVAKESKIIAECGSYQGLAAEVLQVSSMRSDNMHRLKNVRTRSVIAYTNNPPRGAFRGFGGQQMSFAVNSHLGMLAEKIGMDPLEVLKRNVTRTGDTTVHGWKIGSGGLPECLDEVCTGIGWKGKWGRNGKKGGSSSTRKRGVGLGTAIHVSSNRQLGNWEGSTVVARMSADGRVILITAECDIGQGSNTMITQIVAQELGVPIAHISVVAPDTDVAAFGLGTFASRLTMTAGNAALRAAREMKAKLIALAAEIFAVEEADLEVGESEIFVRSVGPNRKMTYGELARAHIFRVGGEGLQVTATYDTPTVMADKKTQFGNVAPAYSFAAQAVEVEVDTETGQVTVIDTYLAEDCGRALNPIAVHGQTNGAAVQAIGWSLFENLQFQDGQLLNGNFADYTMPTADSVPDIHSSVVETIEPNGPFGAKGASESAIVPGAGAIANAIYDAIGVRLNSLPFTPEKVLAALRANAEEKAGHHA